MSTVFTQRLVFEDRTSILVPIMFLCDVISAENFCFPPLQAYYLTQFKYQVQQAS